MSTSFSHLCVSYSSKLYHYGGKMWASPSVSRVGYKCNCHLGLALMFVISAHKLRHGYLWDTANFILSWLEKKLVLPRAHKKDRGLSSVTGSEKASFANLLLNHFLPKAPLSFPDEANVGDAKQTTHAVDGCDLRRPFKPSVPWLCGDETVLIWFLLLLFVMFTVCRLSRPEFSVQKRFFISMGILPRWKSKGYIKKP